MYSTDNSFYFFGGDLDWSMDDLDLEVSPQPSLNRHTPPPPPPPPLPEPDRSFTPSIFSHWENPAASYLDPDGYKDIWTKYKHPRSSAWAKLCPNTYRLAEALYNGLTQKRVWGKQVDFKQWTTFTDGLRRTTAKWPDSRIELIDILNALGNPDRYAVGTTDRRISDDYADCEWINPDTSIGVKRICIDVDFDFAYKYEKIDLAKRELQAEAAALKYFGLPAYWMRTGGRGHQIIIPIPRMSRSLASLLTLMVRFLLSQVKIGGAKIDKCNITSIMRMPLGRHAATGMIAWMIDPESATNLPLDQQVETCIRAWRYQSGSCEWLESEIEHLAIEMSTYYPDLSQDVGAGVADDKLEMLLFSELDALPLHLELMKRFRAACDSISSSPNKQVIYRVTVTDQEIEDAPALAPSDKGGLTSLANSQEEISEVRAKEEYKQPEAPKHRRRVGKGWAQSVIEAGFKEGEFHQWSRSDGQNGVGAAIIVCDGDREAAKELLLSMSEAVPVDAENMKARARWIKWAVQRNNISLYGDAEELRQHKDIAGIIAPKETQIAIKLVGMLMERKGKRRINNKGVQTLTHLIELAQVHMRHSPSNQISISARTFEAEIAARWPEDETTQMDVHRKLALITAGDECIVEALRPTTAARSAYDAQRFVWGADYLSAKSENGQKNRKPEHFDLQRPFQIAL